MKYITSRPYPLPSGPEEMAAQPWFNIWTRRLWPYDALGEGDTLYWYESREQAIRWRTHVSAVYSFPFQSKQELERQLHEWFGPGFNAGSEREAKQYVQGKAEFGYCLAFKVEPEQRLNLKKPAEIRFPRQGWLRVRDPLVTDWVSGT